VVRVSTIARDTGWVMVRARTRAVASVGLWV
jgi:hypothetical protein